MEPLGAPLGLFVPLARLGRPAPIAIDGRCGSDKSTLAGLVVHRLGCPLPRMGDFFLSLAPRTPERYAAPGSSVHYERVEAELSRPLRETGAACFRPFGCRPMDFSAPIRAELTGLALVESNYALHPALRGWYDRTVFLTCFPGEQRPRLLVREGPKRLPAFLERWISLGEAYFQSASPPGGCDLVLDVTPWYHKWRWNRCSVPPPFQPVKGFFPAG